MRHRLALAALCLLTSCNAPESPAQTAFALEAGYDAAVDVAIAYAMLPRCVTHGPTPCADPTVVRKANDIAHQAWQAIRAAQAAAQAIHADPAATASALAKAREALGNLRALTSNMKVS